MGVHAQVWACGHYDVPKEGDRHENIEELGFVTGTYFQMFVAGIGVCVSHGRKMVADTSAVFYIDLDECTSPVRILGRVVRTPYERFKGTVPPTEYRSPDDLAPVHAAHRAFAIASAAHDAVFGVLQRRMLCYGAPAGRFVPVLYNDSTLLNDVVQLLALCVLLADAPNVADVIARCSAPTSGVAASELLLLWVEACGFGQQHIEAAKARVRGCFANGALATPDLRIIRCLCPGSPERPVRTRATHLRGGRGPRALPRNAPPCPALPRPATGRC